MITRTYEPIARYNGLYDPCCKGLLERPPLLEHQFRRSRRPSPQTITVRIMYPRVECRFGCAFDCAFAGFVCALAQRTVSLLIQRLDSIYGIWRFGLLICFFFHCGLCIRIALLNCRHAIANTIYRFYLLSLNVSLILRHQRLNKFLNFLKIFFFLHYKNCSPSNLKFSLSSGTNNKRPSKTVNIQ